MGYGEILSDVTEEIKKSFHKLILDIVDEEIEKKSLDDIADKDKTNAQKARIKKLAEDIEKKKKLLAAMLPLVAYCNPFTKIEICKDKEGKDGKCPNPVPTPKLPGYSKCEEDKKQCKCECKMIVSFPGSTYQALANDILPNSKLPDFWNSTTGAYSLSCACVK